MQVQGITPWRGILCCALAFAVSANASVIVQLKVIEGEGGVYRTGSRATRGLTVLVTDETGKPVPMAAVSFRLPDEGASGTFSSGLRTEIVTTGPDGKASVWGMQWNKTPGPVEIRITAIKEQARAGLISTQYLSDSTGVNPGVTKSGGDGVFTASHSHKWLWIAAIAAGAAGAGAAFSLSKGSSSAPSSSPAVVGISIGSPTIIVGHP
jgi:hypothetical protein